MYEGEGGVTFLKKSEGSNDFGGNDGKLYYNSSTIKSENTSHHLYLGGKYGEVG